MDLDLSESELAFQDEARAWLDGNVPDEPLPSMDTEAGFRAHQEWEAKLAEARWSVVSWPSDYHGRDASLVEWVIFEEEYYRAGAPGRVSQNGIFLLAPILFDHGTPEQQDRFLPSMATGEQVWAQAWSEPEAGSDLASLRSTATRDDERGGWVLNGQKTWSSRASYAHWGFGLFRSDPAAAAPRRPDLLPVPARRRGGHGPADRPARRRGGFRRDLPRGRVRARLRRPRRAWRRLAGRDEYGGQRARACPCAPPAGSARPRTGWSSCGGAYGRRAHLPTRRLTCRRLDQGAGLPALHVGHGHPAGRRRRPGRRRLGQQGLLVRARRRPARDRPRPARPGGRGGVGVDATATCSRSPARSTPAPTRSSATSSPSGSSASPGSPREAGDEVRAHLRAGDFAQTLDKLLSGARHRGRGACLGGR